MKEIKTISVQELKDMAMHMYGGQFVKAVVDIEQQRVVVDAEMHVDEEAYLLETGSNQTDIWGINLYPEKFNTEDFIEFDSMVNIRPRQNNPSRRVQDPDTQQKIRALIAQVVKE